MLRVLIGLVLLFHCYNSVLSCVLWGNQRQLQAIILHNNITYNARTIYHTEIDKHQIYTQQYQCRTQWIYFGAIGNMWAKQNSKGTRRHFAHQHNDCANIIDISHIVTKDNQTFPAWVELEISSQGISTATENMTSVQYYYFDEHNNRCLYAWYQHG